jgi:hypothetical protein
MMMMMMMMMKFSVDRTSQRDNNYCQPLATPFCENLACSQLRRYYYYVMDHPADSTVIILITSFRGLEIREDV